MDPLLMSCSIGCSLIVACRNVSGGCSDLSLLPGNAQRWRLLEVNIINYATTQTNASSQHRCGKDDWLSRAE